MQQLLIENLFQRFLLKLKYWKGDSKIRNFQLMNKNLGIHDVNYKCLEFEVEHEVKPGNVTMSLNELVSEDYALTIELSPKWNIDAHLNISSTNVKKLTQISQTYDTFMRRYLNFEKTTDNTCKHIRSAACIDLAHAPKRTEAHDNLCMSLQELFTSTCGIKAKLTLHKTYRISSQYIYSF